MKRQYTRRRAVHQRYHKKPTRRYYYKKKTSMPQWINRRNIAIASAALAVFLAFVGIFSNRLAPDIQIKAKNGTPPVISISAVHDMDIHVYDVQKKELVTMGLEDYIAHVTAGEMPASYEPEALKAQSIAARTYAVRKMVQLGGSGCNQHEGADVCTSSAHCQAYMSEERMLETWGENTDKYLKKICAAVEETAGLAITYDGAYIDALYHASSGGRTEDSVNVFGGALPYLVGVDSPNEGNGAGNVAKKEISYEEAADLIQKNYPQANVAKGNLKEKIQILSRYESGRVNKLKIGDTQITGKQARALFSLNSSNFTIAFGQNAMTFHTSGFGHGVGMSQAGANAMAKEGNDYEKILTHYYTGIAIEKIKQS